MLTSFIQQEDKDLISWKASQKLTWSDFRAAPPQNAPNAALTSSGILIKFATNGSSLSFEITCNFDKRSSWGRVKNDHILAHEQGHFDIAEIHARKLNKAMSGYRYRQETVNKDVNAIYRKVMDELVLMQNEYDKETDYSRNFPQPKVVA